MGMVPMGCRDLPCKQLFPGRVDKNPVLRDFLQAIFKKDIRKVCSELTVLRILC
jgi:hypothetical protein